MVICVNPPPDHHQPPPSSRFLQASSHTGRRADLASRSPSASVRPEAREPSWQEVSTPSCDHPTRRPDLTGCTPPNVRVVRSTLGTVLDIAACDQASEAAGSSTPSFPVCRGDPVSIGYPVEV
jgi:hypothetical protein